MNEQDVWRVLIVEDDEQVRDYFSQSVARCAQLTLAASVGTLAQAKAWVDRYADTLDVLLTDLGLPDGSGLDLIRYAAQCNPAIQILVISMFGDEVNVLASIKAGALGYIQKDSTPEDVSRTILDMRAGASPISPMIARRLLAEYRSSNKNDQLGKYGQALEAIENGANSTLLSPRELDVLTLVARGFSYAEMAGLLKVSMHTVQSHIKKIYSKLSVHSKNEAVFEATRLGLLNGRG